MMRESMLTVATPLGPLALTASGRGLTSVCFAGGARAKGSGCNDLLRLAAAQLAAYFKGRLKTFDLPLDVQGTPFDESVWARVRAIPYGSTASYGELARRLGKPGSARAVGRANGANPVPIFTPCHRVVGARGALTGYRGGTDRKAFLLQLESGQKQLFSR